MERDTNVSDPPRRRRESSTLPLPAIPEPLYSAMLALVQAIKTLPTLQAVILFGSAVTGELHKKSDIDVLVLFDADHNPELGEEAQIIHARAGEIEQAYELEHPFSFVFVNRSEHVDTDFLWEVARDGVMLYALPACLVGDEQALRPVLIVSYDMSGLPRKDRVYVERRLFGYQARPVYKEKKYAIAREGLVTRHGTRLGRGAFMIDARDAQETLRLLDERGIPYTVTRAWV